MITGVSPGDVLAVRTGGFDSWWIRFGASVKGLPNLENHIAVLHHQDPGGIWWAIEGRPGGVGWVNAAEYLNSPWTVTNRNQEKDGTARSTVCAIIEALLHTPYDWPAIAADAMTDLHLPTLWTESWGGTEPPGHVVCSSLASWAYRRARLSYPQLNVTITQPGDWTQFIISNRYE